MLTESLMQSNGWRSLALALTLIGGVATIIGSGGGGSGGTGGNGGGASSFTYVRSYGSASGSHSAPNAKPAPDGGAVFATLEYGLPDPVTGGATASLVVTKTDSAGDVQWSRAYGQPRQAAIPLLGVVGIAPASDGGVFVAGHGFDGAAIVKLDGAGQFQWSRTYSASGLPRTVNSIAATADGGFVLGGWAEWARDDGSGKYSKKGWILKAGADGRSEHQRVNLGAVAVDEDEIVNRVRPNGEGAYMLTGDVGPPLRSRRSFWIAGVGTDLSRVLHSSTHSGLLAAGEGLDIVRTSATDRVASYLAVGYNRATGAIGGSPDHDSAAVHLQAPASDVLWEIDAGITPAEDDYVAVITEPSADPKIDSVVVAGNVANRYPDATVSGRLHFYPRVDFSRFGTPLEIRLSDWFQLPNNRIQDVVLTGAGEYVVAGSLSSSDDRHPTWVMKFNRTLAQPLLWSKTFDDECSESSARREILALPNGDLLVADEQCVRRLDAAGNVLWVKTTGSGATANAFSHSSPVVVAAGDGSYLVAASFLPGGSATVGDQRGWLLRLDSRGDVVWERQLGDSGRVTGAAEVDGGFALTGSTGQDGWLRKIAPSGQLLWARSYANIAVDELVAGRDGLLLAGDDTLIKTDSAGTLQWSRRLSSRSLTEASDGGYFGLAGPTVVVRLNADGSQRWSNRYTLGPGEDDRWRAVRATADGGAVLAGHTARDQTHCLDRHDCFDIALARIDAEGIVQWAKTHGTGSSEWTTSLDIASDGGILVAGLSQAFQFPRRSTLVIRADAQGAVSEQCPSGIGEPLVVTQFPQGALTDTDPGVSVSTPATNWLDTAFGTQPRTPVTARACIALRFGPTASFTVSPVSPTAGALVTFDASASRDDGPIARYEWDFQDDGSVDATGVMAQFSYTSAGVVRVRLRVTDADGATDEATRSLTIDSAGQTATFSDGTFADTDWRTSVYQNGNGGTLSAAQQTSGGNPGAYRLVTLIVNPGPPGARSNIFAFHWHTPSLYDPASSGAIATIDYSEDALGPGVAAAMVLRQGGNVYFANPTYHVTAGTGWNTAAQNGLTAADFVLLAPDLTQSAQRPDFSATASPIEFGFLRALTSGLGCCGAGGPQGVDNWRVTVHR